MTNKAIPKGRLVFRLKMPKYIIVQNNNREISSPTHIKYCDTFLTQLGFSFRFRIMRDEGLIIVRKYDSRIDSSITMFFVPFDLTVVWINSKMQVVDKVLAKTWRPGYFPKRPARYMLEIHPERWEEFEVGDTVEFQDV